MRIPFPFQSPLCQIWRGLRFASRLFLSLLVASAACSYSESQQTPSGTQQNTSAAPVPAAPRSQTRSAADKSAQEREIEKQEQSRRVLGVIPDFGVTNRQNASPLSPGQKFHLFVTEALDPGTIGVVALQAGLSQAENEFPAYGQGAQGYGKRFGASLADEVSAGFWSNYAYPTLLKEDPRYFRLGEGGGLHRAFYSVKQEFVCHTDPGGRSFNFSAVLGAFTSGAISNIYYPGRSLLRTIPATSTTPAIPVYENDRGAVLTLSRTSIALGYGVLGSLFDEFWPDVQRKLFGKHKQESPAPPPIH